jgi:uncharacterized membrane protein
MFPNLIVLILLSIVWVILFILWIRFVIWDIKLNKINEQLNIKLSQALKEIQRIQTKSSQTSDGQPQVFLSSQEKYYDKSDGTDSVN